MHFELCIAHVCWIVGHPWQHRALSFSSLVSLPHPQYPLLPTTFTFRLLLQHESINEMKCRKQEFQRQLKLSSLKVNLINQMPRHKIKREDKISSQLFLHTVAQAVSSEQRSPP